MSVWHFVIIVLSLLGPWCTHLHLCVLERFYPDTTDKKAPLSVDLLKPMFGIGLFKSLTVLAKLPVLSTVFRICPVKLIWSNNEIRSIFALTNFEFPEPIVFLMINFRRVSNALRRIQFAPIRDEPLGAVNNPR